MPSGLAWLMLGIGIGYLFLTTVSKLLRKKVQFVDFAGAMVLTGSGAIGITHTSDTGWFFTLVLAGSLVGIICLGVSLTRWSTQ